MVGLRAIFMISALLLQHCHGFLRPQCRPGVIQMANPEDCHSYYMCDSLGRAVLVRCAGNKRYNPLVGQCVGGGRRAEATCWPDGRSAKPNPENCSSYYKCVEGRIVFILCPAGSHYSAVEQRCEAGSRSSCRSPQAHRMDCHQVSIHGWPRTYQNPDDCTTYYTCNQGRPVLTPCARGLNFNPERGSCDDTIPRGCKPRDRTPINYRVHE